MTKRIASQIWIMDRLNPPSCAAYIKLLRHQKEEEEDEGHDEPHPLAPRLSQRKKTGLIRFLSAQYLIFDDFWPSIIIRHPFCP